MALGRSRSRECEPSRLLGVPLLSLGTLEETPGWSRLWLGVPLRLWLGVALWLQCPGLRLLSLPWALSPRCRSCVSKRKWSHTCMPLRLKAYLYRQ